MSGLLKFLSDNIVTILVSVILPIVITYINNLIQRNKIKADAFKASAEGEKAEAEANDIVVNSSGKIITFWQNALEKVTRESQECVERNKVIVETTEKLKKDFFKIQADHRFLLDAVKDLFEIMGETTPDVFVLLNAEKEVIFVSSNVTESLGYSVNEFLGVNAYQFVHPDDFTQANTLFQQLLDVPGVSIMNRLRYKHRNGDYRWIEAVGNNLLEHDRVHAIIVNFRDITNRKMIEEEFKLRFKLLEELN